MEQLTPFQAALRRQRERLNARFSLARRHTPRLQPARVLYILREALAPALNTLASHPHAAQDRVLDELYTLALELASSDLLGHEHKHPEVLLTWRELLPACGPLLVSHARHLAGAFTNATLQLTQQSDALASSWRRLMLNVLPHAQTPERALALGRVCAWRVGMVSQRESALQVLSTLDFPALSVLLDIPPDFPESLRFSWLEAMRARPWTPPSVLAQQLLNPALTLTSQLTLVSWVGDFTGLGGELKRPPQLSTAFERLCITDGVHHFLVLADCFGQYLQRLPAQVELGGPVRTPLFSLTPDGSVTHPSGMRRFPRLRGAHQAASTRTELGVVYAQSHRLCLVAVVEALP